MNNVSFSRRDFFIDHTDSPCGSTNSDDSTLPSQTSLNNSLSASHSTSLNETSRPSNSFRYPFPDQDVRISGHPRYNALPEPLLPSPSPFNSPLLPPSNHFHSPSPPPPDAEPKRIPRPPNAFILYRSDVLRQIRTGQRQLPYNEQEKKQQVLSRVAGEGWNLLSPEEKKVWQDKAAEVQAEHHKKYPTYKFTPSARGPALRKRKGGQAGQFSSDDGSEVDEKVRIREMREMYLHIAGPAIPSAPRRRRTRAQTAPKADYSSEVSFRAQDPHFVPLPPSFPPTPLSTPELSARNGATLPPFFPRPTYPLYPDQIANFAYGGVHHNDFGGEHMMFPFSTAAMGGSYPSSAASSPGASTSMHMHNDHNTMFVHQANASTSYFPPPQHGQRAFFPAPHPHGVHQYDNHMRAHSSSPLSLSPVSVINAGMVNFPNHGYLYTMPASAPASPASLASPPPPSAYSGSRPSSAASSDQMHGQETMASPPKTPSLTASSDDGLSERTRNLDIVRVLAHCFQSLPILFTFLLSSDADKRALPQCFALPTTAVTNPEILYRGPTR